MDGGEVLEPILASPYVRDHFGRKACDLLPPEHVSSMRVAFRGEITDLPIAHSRRDAVHPMMMTQTGKGTTGSKHQDKISFFDKMFSIKHKDEDNRPSLKHTDPTNVVSTGMLSPAPRSL